MRSVGVVDAKIYCAHLMIFHLSLLQAGSAHDHFDRSRKVRYRLMGRRQSESSFPRLLIADDHAIFAESLRASLEKTFAIVGITLDGRTTVEEAVRLAPDVVIVDIGMPLLNGLDAARRIRDRDPHVKFVFLTMQDDPNLAAAALELGHVAFVLKHSGVSELQKAIEHVLRGQEYMTPKLRAEDWTETKARVRQFSRELTQRQRDIVQLFAEGGSIKEIAAQLGLSEKTVEFHKHHIMTAFNLKTNAALVLFALKHGLISINSEPPS
jgi:DNA-binding NarL/FixJ family response regulator